MAGPNGAPYGRMQERRHELGPAGNGGGRDGPARLPRDCPGAPGEQEPRARVDGDRLPAGSREADDPLVGHDLAGARELLGTLAELHRPPPDQPLQLRVGVADHGGDSRAQGDADRDRHLEAPRHRLADPLLLRQRLLDLVGAAHRAARGRRSSSSAGREDDRDRIAREPGRLAPVPGGDVHHRRQDVVHQAAELLRAGGTRARERLAHRRRARDVREERRDLGDAPQAENGGIGVPADVHEPSREERHPILVRWRGRHRARSGGANPP